MAGDEDLELFSEEDYDVRVCPKCKSKENYVDDTRILKSSGFLMRYRVCLSCKNGWRTYEIHRNLLKKLVGFYNSSAKVMQKYNEDADILAVGKWGLN